MATQRMASVPAAEIGGVVADLTADSDRIVAEARRERTGVSSDSKTSLRNCLGLAARFARSAGRDPAAR